MGNLVLGVKVGGTVLMTVHGIKIEVCFHGVNNYGGAKLRITAPSEVVINRLEFPDKIKKHGEQSDDENRGNR